MTRRKVAGFTLLELTAVLIIVALITGMGMVATMGALESARRTATENKLGEIEKALMAFRTVHNRLPCPAQISLASSDSNSGIESANTGSCTGSTPAANIWDKYWDPGDADTDLADRVAEGGVPVKALGLPNEFMYDGWGRKITYLVMAAYTSLDAFSGIHPQENCGMSIYANNNADEEKTSRAAYVLISHGPNGHGAYLRGGSRMSAASTNVAEQLNCRCSDSLVAQSSVTGAVQKDFSEDSASATNTFDDIVRFKERWQMQTPNDDKSFGTYTQAQMFIAVGGDQGEMSIYQKQCDNFIRVGTGAAVMEVNHFIGMTEDNAYIFSYDMDYLCQLYPISGLTLSVPVATSSCPTYALDNAVSLSKSGHLGITKASSPYFNVWRYGGGDFNLLPFKFLSTPASQPDRVAISPLGDQYFLADSGSWAKFYYLNKDNLVEVTSPPASLPTTVNATAYSPDGKYFALSDNSELYLWRVTGPNSFSARITNADNTTGSALGSGLSGYISSIAFSPNGEYIALGASGSSANVTGKVSIYKIDSSADGATVSITPVSISGNFTGGYTSTLPIGAVNFTPDSKYLVAVEQINTTRAIINLKRQGTLAFTYHGGTNEELDAGDPSRAAMYH